MAKVLMLDHKEYAQDVATSIYRRLRQEIPDIEMRLERDCMPERIPPDYDYYLVHLSSTDVDRLEELREENPSAFIIGMSDMCCVEPEMPEILEKVLDAYTERGASERNLDRLARLIRSRA